MIGSQHQPATEKEGDVENAGADDEANDGGEGETQGDQEHVVLVQVTKEAQQPTPLTKDSQTNHNASVIHQQYATGLCLQNTINFTEETMTTTTARATTDNTVYSRTME